MPRLLQQIACVGGEIGVEEAVVVADAPSRPAHLGFGGTAEEALAFFGREDSDGFDQSGDDGVHVQPGHAFAETATMSSRAENHCGNGWCGGMMRSRRSGAAWRCSSWVRGETSLSGTSLSRAPLSGTSLNRTPLSRMPFDLRFEEAFEGLTQRFDGRVGPAFCDHALKQGEVVFLGQGALDGLLRPVEALSDVLSDALRLELAMQRIGVGLSRGSGGGGLSGGAFGGVQSRSPLSGGGRLGGGGGSRGPSRPRRRGSSARCR